MAWIFVHKLGPERDGYGVWWIRSVWQDGDNERCERGKFYDEPTDEQIVEHLNAVAGMLNAPPIPTPEEQQRADLLAVLDTHREVIEAAPELNDALCGVLGVEAIPVPVEAEPVKVEEITMERMMDAGPIREHPIEPEPVPGEVEPLEGGR
jgi:hypothetical protein